MRLADYRKIIDKVNADLRAALKAHGLECGGNIKTSIDEIGGGVKITINATDPNHKGADGKATNPEREFWKMSADLRGLDVAWLDKPFRSGGREYTIVGMRQRGARPVLARRTDDGKTYVFPVDNVIAFMKQQEAAR